MTLAVFAGVYVAIGGAVFPIDDAFINLHNAQVVREGHDASYVGVPALVGATSGVHLALLLAIEHIVSPDTLALFVLGALSGALYVLGLFLICTNVGCASHEAMLIALGGLILAGTLFQFLNGMDTGLAMAAIAWNIKLLTDRRRTLSLPLLCGIMPFIRPELGFLSIASMLMVLWEDRDPRVRIAACAVAMLGALPFPLWYWIDTGSWFPSTAGAKMYYFADRDLDMSDKALFLLTAMSRAAVATFPLFLCVRCIRPRGLGLMLALFAMVFVGSYLWRFPSGLVHNGGRYLYLFAPIVLFGVACGLTSSARRHSLRLAAVAMLFLPLAIGAQASVYVGHLRGYSRSLADAVRWMNDNLPGTPTVMVHDAGYVAYAGHFPLIDLVGLKTPAASEFHRRLTYPSVGRQRPEAIAGIARSFGPDYLLAIQNWDEIFGITDGLRQNGWTVTEVYAGQASPDTPAADIYHVYRLTGSPPPATGGKSTD